MLTSDSAVQQYIPDNLFALINDHAFNESLTVKKLARIVAMSRTDLHRKLIGTVGMSATEYIRHIRLNKASVLLLEKRELSICEVAIEVGFNTQSYFSKRFREVFGKSPSEWRMRKLEHTSQNLEHT
jgi:AraC-like DNA-binding protein